MDIYTLSLANLDDAALTSLLAKLPQNCIILLEDIDAATSNRVQSRDEDSDSVSGDSEKKQGKKVTLCGLLNALDGVGSQEGRLLIMTTNYVERLDDALIRPGRADVKVKFRLADRDLIGQLFRLVFKGSDDITTVERLADEFADQVPESKFSPAEVLSLLLEHRMCPGDAVAGVEAWVDKITEEKRGLRREGSWLYYA